MSWTLDFGDPSATDASRTGGKGSSLARLFQAGFPVPEGFVVTADADRASRGEDPLIASALGQLDF